VTEPSDASTTPEEVANVLILGVLEQMPVRVPDLSAHLARAGPIGHTLAGEDRILAEAIAASLAVSLLPLERRLSLEDLHGVHQGVHDYIERMLPGLFLYVLAYYVAMCDLSGDARLEALGRTFRARCHGVEPEALVPDPSEDRALGARLVPRGHAPLADDIARLLRNAALNR